MKEPTAESVLEKTFEYLQEVIGAREEKQHEKPATPADTKCPQDDQEPDSDSQQLKKNRRNLTTFAESGTWIW